MIDPQLWQDLVIFVTELEKNSAGNGERASKRVRLNQNGVTGGRF